MIWLLLLKYWRPHSSFQLSITLHIGPTRGDLFSPHRWCTNKSPVLHPRNISVLVRNFCVADSIIFTRYAITNAINTLRKKCIHSFWLRSYIILKFLFCCGVQWFQRSIWLAILHRVTTRWCPRSWHIATGICWSWAFLENSDILVKGTKLYYCCLQWKPVVWLHFLEFDFLFTIGGWSSANLNTATFFWFFGCFLHLKSRFGDGILQIWNPLLISLKTG